MPANKYALLRYRIIDKCIRNKYRPYPNAEDLRQACEEYLYHSFGEKVSKSTIEKDLYAMRNESELGYYAPIKYSKAEKGFYYEDPNYSIDNLPLNEEDIDALKVATATLLQFKDVAIFKQFGFAINKIMERISLADAQDDDLSKYIHFEPKPANVGTGFINPCLQAIQNRRKLSFTYQKFGAEKPKQYLLNPFAIKEYKNLWYVIGLDLEVDLIKTFALDRIQELEVIDEYAGKHNFNVQQYFNNTLGVTHPHKAQVETICCEIASDLVPYLRVNPLHPSQKIEEQKGKNLLTLELIINPELEQNLRAFGRKLVVTRPEKLKISLS